MKIQVMLWGVWSLVSALVCAQSKDAEILAKGSRLECAAVVQRLVAENDASCVKALRERLVVEHRAVDAIEDWESDDCREKMALVGLLLDASVLLDAEGDGADLVPFLGWPNFEGKLTAYAARQPKRRWPLIRGLLFAGETDTSFWEVAWELAWKHHAQSMAQDLLNSVFTIHVRFAADWDRSGPKFLDGPSVPFTGGWFGAPEGMRPQWRYAVVRGKRGLKAPKESVASVTSGTGLRYLVRTSSPDRLETERESVAANSVSVGQRIWARLKLSEGKGKDAFSSFFDFVLNLDGPDTKDPNPAIDAVCDRVHALRELLLQEWVKEGRVKAGLKVAPEFWKTLWDLRKEAERGESKDPAQGLGIHPADFEAAIRERATSDVAAVVLMGCATRRVDLVPALYDRLSRALSKRPRRRRGSDSELDPRIERLTLLGILLDGLVFLDDKGDGSRLLSLVDNPFLQVRLLAYAARRPAQSWPLQKALLEARWSVETAHAAVFELAWANHRAHLLRWMLFEGGSRLRIIVGDGRKDEPKNDWKWSAMRTPIAIEGEEWPWLGAYRLVQGAQADSGVASIGSGDTGWRILRANIRGAMASGLGDQSTPVIEARMKTFFRLLDRAGIKGARLVLPSGPLEFGAWAGKGLHLQIDPMRDAHGGFSRQLLKKAIAEGWLPEGSPEAPPMLFERVERRPVAECEAEVERHLRPAPVDSDFAIDGDLIISGAPDLAARHVAAARNQGKQDLVPILAQRLRALREETKSWISIFGPPRHDQHALASEIIDALIFLDDEGKAGEAVAGWAWSPYTRNKCFAYLAAKPEERLDGLRSACENRSYSVRAAAWDLLWSIAPQRLVALSFGQRVEGELRLVMAQGDSDVQSMPWGNESKQFAPSSGGGAIGIGGDSLPWHRAAFVLPSSFPPSHVYEIAELPKGEAGEALAKKAHRVLPVGLKGRRLAIFRTRSAGLLQLEPREAAPLIDEMTLTQHLQARLPEGAPDCSFLEPSHEEHVWKSDAEFLKAARAKAESLRDSQRALLRYLAEQKLLDESLLRSPPPIHLTIDDWRGDEKTKLPPLKVDGVELKFR